MIPGLGARIVQARKAVGLSQTALAARMGLSRHNLSKIENGHTASPGVWHIVQIADVCGVTTDWLVGRTPCPRRGEQRC